MIISHCDVFPMVVDGLVNRYPNLNPFNFSEMVEDIRENWPEALKKSPEYPGGIIAHCKDESGFSGQLDKLENHRKFIDIHVLLSGIEQVYWELMNEEFIHTPYNYEKDVEWYFPYDPLCLTYNNSVVLLIEPGYVHRTLPASSSQVYTKKIVFKVPSY